MIGVLHDMVCESCGRTDYDVLCQGEFRKTCLCGGTMEILWKRRAQSYIGIHPKDRAVIWYNPETGKHATPGRNDVPMPARYAKDGYVRREFNSLLDLDNYCKSEKLVNEASHYNKGNAYDD